MVEYMCVYFTDFTDLILRFVSRYLCLGTSHYCENQVNRVEGVEGILLKWRSTCKYVWL